MEDGTIESNEVGLSKNPWDNPEKEVQYKHEPVNYSKIVGDNRLLILRDKHSNRRLKEHISLHASDLKAAGITHYAIEANVQGNRVFVRLNAGEDVYLGDVAVGPELPYRDVRKSYEEAIKAMAAVGIPVVAVDDQSQDDPEERERRMAENLKSILEEDPDAKVAFLVGGLHGGKKDQVKGVDTLAKRMVDAEIPTVDVVLTGGEPSDSGVKDVITHAAKNVGLDDEEFMLDMRPYAHLAGIPTPFNADLDYIIHVAQTPLVEEDKPSIFPTSKKISIPLLPTPLLGED